MVASANHAEAKAALAAANEEVRERCKVAIEHGLGPRYANITTLTFPLPISSNGYVVLTIMAKERGQIGNVIRCT